MSSQFSPDFEDRNRFAVAVCQHLNLDPGQILAGTLRVEIGPDNRHTVEWQGRAHVTSAELTQILEQIRTQVTDTPTDEPQLCDASRLPPPGAHEHRCHRPPDHPGDHYCHACPAIWSDTGNHA